jgi:hypothetical protein
MWIIEKAKALSCEANPSDIQKPKEKSCTNIVYEYINKCIKLTFAKYTVRECE